MDYNSTPMEPSPLITGASQRAEWTRVIVLAPPSEQSAPSADGAIGVIGVIQRLQPEFEKRDWFAIVHSDPYLAFAELALRERAQAARAAWGLQRMEGLALVVVEPERWPVALLDDLRRAVRRSLPAASLWTASGDRIEPADSPPPTTKATERLSKGDFTLGSRQPSEVHALRGSTSASNVSENGSAEPDAVTETSDRAGLRDAGRLSREEIDMLLHENELDIEQPGGREAGA